MTNYLYEAKKQAAFIPGCREQAAAAGYASTAHAYAAIAQAEAAERQAIAMERIADMWESALINVAPGDQRWLALRTYDAVSAERYYAP